MTLAVVSAGVLVQMVAWRAVARGRGTVWTATVPALAFAGAGALLLGPGPATGEVAPAIAVAVGIGAGLGLYLATLAFVIVAGPRWPAFTRHSVEVYRERGALPLPLVLLLAAGVVALGEELFWRGLVLRWADEAVAGPLAATAQWLGYVAVNAAGVNLAIGAGAVVGGAVWTLLALWTDGALASVACHACWTALMVARPVVPAGTAAP